MQWNHRQVQLCGPRNHIVNCNIFISNENHLIVKFVDGWLTFCNLNDIAPGDILEFKCEAVMDNNLIIVNQL
jgi:hypothetical protein